MRYQPRDQGHLRKRRDNGPYPIRLSSGKNTPCQPDSSTLMQSTASFQHLAEKGLEPNYDHPASLTRYRAEPDLDICTLTPSRNESSHPTWAVLVLSLAVAGDMPRLDRRPENIASSSLMLFSRTSRFPTHTHQGIVEGDGQKVAALLGSTHASPLYRLSDLAHHSPRYRVLRNHNMACATFVRPGNGI